MEVVEDDVWSVWQGHTDDGRDDDDEGGMVMCYSVTRSSIQMLCSFSV